MVAFEMVDVTVDGKQIQAPKGSLITAAALMAGVKIPTLCYFRELNEISACRVCVVEIEGQERLVPACSTKIEGGEVIFTNSPKVREARKTNVELILSQHKTECTSCVRSGNCTLQTIANDLNITKVPFTNAAAEEPWDELFPLIRDASKCVKCMRCIQVCENIQGIGVWTLKNHGGRTTIGVNGDVTIDASKCVICGQCVTHCPVGALTARDDTQKVWDAIADPEITTVVQVAPAVRTAWADVLGIPREKATPGKMVNALRKMGFDYIFDTDFSADLTIMEEGNELLERLAHKDDYTWPMFTSCCPGWVRYMKGHRPEQVKQLSTSKSPQQMFGATCKALFKMRGINPDKLFCVSIMPCMAKKYECAVPQMWDVAGDAGVADVDASLTTRELTRMIRVAGVTAQGLVEDNFDDPMGEATGAGHIFGATGGVMEAALRTAYAVVTGENPDPEAFSAVRGMDGWKEQTFDIKGTPVRVAVASGLANTERLMRALDAGEVEYDFVEIMACPGGCAGGGGQPIRDGVEQAEVRGKVLYNLDKTAASRFSHENASVQAAYDELLGAPLSEKAEELLHTDQATWDFAPWK